MSEIRQDPRTEEWIIMAKERSKRPHEFVCQQARPELLAFSPSCPFCPGNEAMTPPETLSYPGQNGQNWRLKAFTNRFAALTPSGKTVRRQEGDFFLNMDGVGVHEVIVETPEHNKPPALMEDSDLVDVLRAYQERHNALSRMPYTRLVIIFKNHGPSAGTSLQHPHSQLIATPVVPRHIRMKYAVAIRYYDNTGRCPYSDLIERELKIGKRIAKETEQFVVFHAFASHLPFETWVVPKTHQASFGNVSEQNPKNLAHVLRIILLKLYRGLNNPDFNYVIDTAPVGDENKDYYL